MTKNIVVPYFPLGLKYITPLIFIGTVYLFIENHLVFAVISGIAGLIILSTNYVTEINLKEKYVKDYLSFLWIPLNQELKKFKDLDCIVITKGNYTQTINTRVQSRQMDWSDYTATLLFDTDSLDLLTRNDKHELLKGLRVFSEFLKVDVEDRTTTQPYRVDMTKID